MSVMSNKKGLVLHAYVLLEPLLFNLISSLVYCMSVMLNKKGLVLHVFDQIFSNRTWTIS